MAREVPGDEPPAPRRTQQGRGTRRACPRTSQPPPSARPAMRPLAAVRLVVLPKLAFRNPTDPDVTPRVTCGLLSGTLGHAVAFSSVGKCIAQPRFLRASDPPLKSVHGGASPRASVTQPGL